MTVRTYKEGILIMKNSQNSDVCLDSSNWLRSEKIDDDDEARRKIYLEKRMQLLVRRGVVDKCKELIAMVERDRRR
ncbi:hypothetical protein ACOME3_003543 [Neoechinorhynchus agilis]